MPKRAAAGAPDPLTRRTRGCGAVLTAQPFSPALLPRAPPAAVTAERRHRAEDGQPGERRGPQPARRVAAVSVTAHVVEHVRAERRQSGLRGVAEVAPPVEAGRGAPRRRTGPPSCAASCSGCSSSRSPPRRDVGADQHAARVAAAIGRVVESNSGSVAAVRAPSVTPLTAPVVSSGAPASRPG